jgi:hypothetical protein
MPPTFTPKPDTFWRSQFDAIQRSNDDPISRRKVVHRMILHLQRSPDLLSWNHPDYPMALNLTWQWLNAKIGEFDLSKSVVKGVTIERALLNWVNKYLRYRFKDLCRLSGKDISLDATTTDETGNTMGNFLESHLALPTLSGLEAVIAQEQRQAEETLYQKMQAWILADLENTLKSCHPKAASTCNCHILAQRLVLRDPPDNATQLAQELGVNYQTLMTQWKRRCRPILQDQTEAFGGQDTVASYKPKRKHLAISRSNP